ncbi:MAG: class I SAM-dependent methyltransferase [Dehalococcoidia bacterium]|mgnify:CR=1 FL=1|nr:class I SAM-dependent methyltransferase [Dehalococcoidia bacterium]
MTNLEDSLASFYDLQAPQRAARNPQPQRIQHRDHFATLLHAEDRTSVIEIGTGTGQDASALQTAGLTVSGIDLSAENVRHCRERGIDAQQASLFEMPFDDDTFDAAWTMSTLLHVPNARLDEALTEITRVLRPGAPLAIGLWGGPDSEHNQHRSRDGIEVTRFFSWRSDDHLRELLEPHGTLERFETWPDSDPESELHYQFCLVRTPGLAAL